jgi:hypothetical protein
MIFIYQGVCPRDTGVRPPFLLGAQRACPAVRLGKKIEAADTASIEYFTVSEKEPHSVPVPLCAFNYAPAA